MDVPIQVEHVGKKTEKRKRDELQRLIPRRIRYTAMTSKHQLEKQKDKGDQKFVPRGGVQRSIENLE